MAYSKPHYLVTCGGTMAGNETWQTGARYYSGDNATAEQLQNNLEAVSASDMYDDVAEIFSYSSVSFPNTTKVGWLKVAAVKTDGLYQGDAAYFTDATPTVGFDAATRLPNQISMCVSLWSGQQLGKGNYGRMFWPGIAGTVGTDGLWSAGVGTTWGANFAAMLLAWAGELATVALPNMYLAIMTQGLTPQNKRVTKLRVGRVPDTQRRRRNALGESYVDTAYAG